MPSKLIASIEFTLLAFLMAATCGCASGPQLESYPRREIERPYTLPEGVAAWHIPTIFGYIRDNSSLKTLPPVPFPLLWESSISDNWNLIWSPVPLGFAYQISNDDKVRNGVSVLTSLSYSDSSGLRLQPHLAYSFRYKFSSNLALVVEPSFKPDIPFKSGEKFLWFGGIAVGPLFQLSNTFSLQPAVSLDIAHGRANNSSDYYDDSEISEKTDTSAGVGVSSVWSISRQWDLRSSYGYSGIGAGNGYRSQIAALDFVHLW